jgi:hypothetical protein
MLQLLELAKENAALKSELLRIRQEAEALQCLLAGGDGSAQRTGAGKTSAHRQIILGATDEV